MARLSFRQRVGDSEGPARDIGVLVSELLDARGALPGGLVWYYSTPPVIGLEYEMDVRGAARELII